MKHSQSFSPFCDSISVDIAPVSLDSSIRSDEDATEGNIFIRVVKKETEKQGVTSGRKRDQRADERESEKEERKSNGWKR